MGLGLGLGSGLGLGLGSGSGVSVPNPNPNPNQEGVDVGAMNAVLMLIMFFPLFARRAPRTNPTRDEH